MEKKHSAGIFMNGAPSPEKKESFVEKRNSMWVSNLPRSLRKRPGYLPIEKVFKVDHVIVKIVKSIMMPISGGI